MATLEELEIQLKALQQEIVLARQETRELAKEKDEQIANLTQQLTESNEQLKQKLTESNEQLKQKLTESNNQFKESLANVSDLTKAAQTTADRGVNLANQAQNTANDAVNRANNAQNTANNAVNRANNAQNTANNADNKLRFLSIREKRSKITSLHMRTSDASLVFGSDGNLQIYRGKSDPEWSTGPQG